MTREINHKSWSRSLIGFIRARGLEQELTDWCGGWPCPIESGERRISRIERLEAINAELGLELSNAIILLKAAGVDETPNGTIARARATIAKALEGEAGNGAS